MHWPQTGVTHYNAQLVLLDKDLVIRGLVVCYVVWLGSMKGMGLRTCARCIGLDPCYDQDGYQEPQIMVLYKIQI